MYKGWADSVNRIEEIKSDFSVGKFNSRDFWVTEAGESFIIMAYNFISLFCHCIINSKQQHFLKTIRYQILSILASLEKEEVKMPCVLSSRPNNDRFFSDSGKRPKIPIYRVPIIPNDRFGIILRPICVMA